MATETQAERVLKFNALPAPTLPGTVRMLLETRLGLLGAHKVMPPGRIDDLYLVASELVTNACAATPDTDIAFKAVFDPRSVLLMVWDSSPATPTAQRPELDMATLDQLPDDAGPNDLPAFGGWGLPIVMALVPETDRTITPTATPPGKWISARLRY